MGWDMENEEQRVEGQMRGLWVLETKGGWLSDYSDRVWDYRSLCGLGTRGTKEQTQRQAT